MFTKEQLLKIGAEKLADVILSLYRNKPDIREELDIILAGLDIKKKIRLLNKFDYYIDCLGSSSFANKIDRIRKQIMEEVLPNSPSLASELLLSLLDTHEKSFERVDDSEGEVSPVYRQACADLGTAYERVNSVNVEDVVKLVYDRFMKNSYAAYDNIIFHFKAVLGDEGLTQLKQKLEDYFDGNKNRYNNETIMSGLKNIADCQNNADAYIQACTLFGELHEKDHLKIAKRLIKNQRGREAIEWLNKKEPTAWQDDRRALKVEALDLCGDHQEAQAERQKRFDISLSAKIYNEIVNHGEAGFIESFKKTAIQKAFMFQDFFAGLKFLIKIQEFEQAAKLVYQNIDALEGTKDYPLHRLAKILGETHSLAATLLYRKRIESSLEDECLAYCRGAAKDLVACDSLSSKISNWQGFKNHQLYFEELSLQHKGKEFFWTEYIRALRKRKAKDVKVTSSKKHKKK